ncbi:MAG: WYL domain-containing protein [Nitrospira sp.]
MADSRKVVGWVLSFGSGVKVLKPDSLREAVRQEAQRIAAQGERGGGEASDAKLKRMRRVGRPAVRPSS